MDVKPLAITIDTRRRRTIARADDAAAVRDEICRQCDAVKEHLLAKNMAYGNSAIDPLRIFSTASPVEQINVRIDDKLSRIARGKNIAKIEEDTELDLVGYFILKRVAVAMSGREPNADVSKVVE